MLQRSPDLQPMESHEGWCLDRATGPICSVCTLSELSTLTGSSARYRPNARGQRICSATIRGQYCSGCNHPRRLDQAAIGDCLPPNNYVGCTFGQQYRCGATRGLLRIHDLPLTSARMFRLAVAVAIFV